jgi:hypothetical protein
MPCWTVKTTSVNIGSMNLQLLISGLEAAGYTVKVDGGIIVFSSSGSYRYHQYKAGELLIQGEDVEGVTASIKRA